MTLVGTSLLAEYCERHPHAKAALSALQALIREAAWTCQADAEARFPALVRDGTPGRLTLAIGDAGVCVVLEANYALGLVRVSAVRPMT